jgi:glyoxylase-like metal-dependent hydrolase (beta-lactamase superfamily II)
VLLTGFPAGAFGTNCWVVAAGPGEQCLVVDPGQDAVGPLEDVLAEHRLTPAAVLLTHGHLDHTWSVAPVCGARGIPAYIHPADRYMLADPGRGVGEQMGRMIAGLTFTEPDDVVELPDDGGLDLLGLGLGLTVRLAPGHTEGSVVFGSADGGPDGVPVLWSGDVLFAGSIGRTDLPGGSMPSMVRTLQQVVLPMADETLVLPGHGGVTTIGRERASNSYLEMAADGLSSLPRGRGL